MQTQQSVFQPVQPVNKLDYPALERRIQRWWDEHQIMRQYLARNSQSDRRFSFIDGPITANNPMGVHHAWGRTYKDLFQRFKTMQGYRQRYQNGFDCQGLWVEVEVEKELGLKNKREIEAYGVAEFVERCKERVRRFAQRQTEQSIRLGYWMDWDHSYYTMSDENNYSIWYFLKRCHERGWIYKGHDVMPWCPRCATGLSNMEIATEGYQMIEHTSVFVRFPLHGREREFLLVWTTTPWTLPANVAAAVHPDLTYVKVRQGEDTYYLAEGAISRLKELRGRDKPEYSVVEQLPGRDLLGLTYEGPFDDLPVQQGVEHRIIPWAEVSATEGTGIVHIAPGCGKEDFELSKEHHLAVLAPIDEFGVYGDGYAWLTGRSAGEVASAVIDDLAHKGLLYRAQKYTHSYPVCWRCGTELVFRLVDEWFISMQELREPMMAVVRRIRWIPEFGLDRELDWLRNMDDWMISKKRYWGLALPIYDCAACGHFEVIGGDDELRERAVAGWEEFAGHTPHRPWVDAVKIRCSHCGSVVSRIKDVGNPWLDAGIVPYSTLNYRHDRAYWREWFPAEFITESFPGQFRNWFYSMLVMSTALENTEPFRTVLGFATLLDEDGEEMHKSRGNAIWFDDAAERVGADTMRWLYVNQPPAHNLNFPRIPTEADTARAQAEHVPVRLSERWLTVRSTLDKLWNIYAFFVTYANIDGFDPQQHQVPVAERSDLDRWALSMLQRTVAAATDGLEAYEMTGPARAISEFVDDLSNWYVRRSRRRFWKSATDSDKAAAYLTLYECLETLTRLLAPFTPFYAEELYQNLVRRVDQAAPQSVHLCDWPVVNERLIDERLEWETRLVMRIVNLGRAAREKAQIKVRQPLAAMYVRVTNDEERASLSRLSAQVLDELNIKHLRFVEEDSDMLVYTLKPVVSILGPVYGKLLPRILAAVRAMDARAAALRLRAGMPLVVDVDGQFVELTEHEVEVVATARAGYVAAEERGYVVAIETALTPELVAEGLVRDLTHAIQDMRKRAGFNIEEHIDTRIVTDAELATLIERYQEYLRDETLSQVLEVRVDGKPVAGEFVDTIQPARLGGHTVQVAISRA